jgi:hypothetical protein
MKIHPVEQRSLEWMQLRAGIPTASEFDNLVTPKWEIRKGQTPATYLAKKLAERWLGGPIADFNTYDMDQGRILEEEAIPWFELERGVSVIGVGFITTDDGRVGCSPDGLIGDHSGIEIKCPAVHTHIGYALVGKLPDDYAAQVQGSLYVTGRQSWTFLSYHRRLPALLLFIEPDAKAQAALREALEQFLAKLEEGWNKLCEMNGGPPVRKVVTMSQPEPEYQDIIP